MPNYRADFPGGFYPWLRQIAKDRIIDAHRRHIQAEKRSVAREANDDSYVSPASASRLVERLVSRDSSPSHQAIRGERTEKLLQAIHQLPGDYRELLLMRYSEQLLRVLASDPLARAF